MTIPAHAFTVPITVQASDIDTNNHVNNVVYLQWIQDVSTAHWRSLVTPEQTTPYAWVVRRHEIDYLRPCFLADNLMAYTWVGHPEGPAFDRFLVILNTETHKPIMQAKTTWYLLDATTMRTRKIPHEILHWFGLE